MNDGRKTYPRQDAIAFGDVFFCSVCGYHGIKTDHEFCPNCGRWIMWGEQ